MLNNIKRIYILGVIIIVFIANFLMSELITIKTRELAYLQNNYNLEHIKYCFNELTQKKHFSRLDAINICSSKSLTLGPTGDAFVLDLKSMKLIWDNSLDCKTGKTMYLTKDSICKLAKDPESCIKLSNNIKKGYHGNFEWNFDGSPEWTSWIILPDEFTNFDGTTRATVGVKDQIVVAQGAQKDEVMSYFNIIKVILNLVSGVIIFIFSILYFHKLKESRLKKD